MSVSFISPASTACADLDMPFRQYDSASAYDVYYYSFDVDSRVITGTGARTPTYDIFIGGQVDNGSIIKPLITSLQASNNYAPLWSYTVNMGN